MRTRRKYWAHNTCSLFLPLICHLGVLFTASFFVHSKLWGFCQAIVWKESLEEFFFKVAIGPFEAVGWQVSALILHHRNGTPPHRSCHLPNYRRLCAVHPRQPPTNRGSFWRLQGAARTKISPKTFRATFFMLAGILSVTFIRLVLNWIFN